MATILKNSITNDIGITPEVILTTKQNNRYTAIGLNLSNTTNSVVKVSIIMKQWEPLATTTPGVGDAGDNNTTIDPISVGYFLKDIMVAPQSSLKAITNSEKLILAPNNSLEIKSNAPTSIDSIISFVEIL